MTSYRIAALAAVSSANTTGSLLALVSELVDEAEVSSGRTGPLRKAAAVPRTPTPEAQYKNTQ
jgi:hypothetical protein